MDEQVEIQLERLKSFRTEQGEPLVLEHENPVLYIDDAITMAQRGGLLYRFAMDGREFEYRINGLAQTPVLKCKMVEAPTVLCNLVEGSFAPKQKEPEAEAETEPFVSEPESAGSEEPEPE